MLPEHLAKRYPKLAADGAEKTSKAARQYNCVAWSAARDRQHWFEPEKLEPWFRWPPELPPNNYDFENFVRLFENLGYEKSGSDDGSFEIHYKKVALYAVYEYFEPKKWGFTHVCDQLISGAWTSKLGRDEDIKHNSLEALAGDAGDEYGTIRLIMKRRCNPPLVLFRRIVRLLRLSAISDRMFR